MIVTVCEALWKSWGNDYKYLNEPKQVKAKYMRCARWGFEPEVRQVFAVMRDRTFINRSLSSNDAVAIVPADAYSYLRTRLRSLHSNSDSPPRGGAPLPADVATVPIEFHTLQLHAAERIVLAWSLMTSIARHRVLSGKRLQDLPPGQFALLLAKDPEKKQNEPLRQKKNLEVLVAAEARLYHPDMGDNVKEVFGYIGFVHNPAVREVIFKLHQHDWRVVPPETEAQCATAFKGLGHSLGNERGFKAIKDWKRTNSRKHGIK